MVICGCKRFSDMSFVWPNCLGRLKMCHVCVLVRQNQHVRNRHVGCFCVSFCVNMCELCVGLMWSYKFANASLTCLLCGQTIGVV